MKKYFFSRYLVLIIVIGFFLFGCATAEYRLVKGECSVQAFQQYPVDNHDEVVTAYRSVRVPTGQTCQKMVTECQNTWGLQRQQYQKTVTVDSNADIRDQTISSCTRSQCLSRYGNAKCKTAPVKPVPATPAPAILPR
jgi:hypothetical protein